MPFQSRRQVKWMFANDPEMAKRWAEHTPDMKDLPEEKHKPLRDLAKRKAKEKH